MGSLDVNTRQLGQGQTTLLFVHGLGCALDDWDAQLTEFSAGYRCVALDLPGHGGSAISVSPSIAALSEAVTSVRELHGISDVVLIGHSLGCKVVREAYCARPEGVRGVIMIDGRHYGGDRDEQRAKFEAALAVSGYVEHMRKHFGEMFHNSTPEAVRQKIVRRALERDPDFATGLLRDAIEWDYVRGEPTLSAIKVPVLSLQSTIVGSGRRRPIKEGERTHFMDLVERLVPDARVGIITECGHFPMFERPDTLNARINEFLGSILLN